MDRCLLYPHGYGAALSCASKRLKAAGYEIADHPMPEITHFLTDAPCKDDAFDILESLPENVTVIGGKLPREILHSYQCFDLLLDEDYLCENAAITAQCALSVGLESGKAAYCGARILVLGWGRIGKHLTQYAKALGAEVCVALRNPKESAMAKSMGLETVEISKISPNGFDYIFNTVPRTVCRLEKKGAPVAVDLASVPGIVGENVIWARGLPGKMAPESSGKLIARRVDEMIKECFK